MQEIIPSTSTEAPGRYYKVKWTRVPDLVEKRRVLMKGGMAYVPAAEQASIVFQEFQSHLEKALAVCILELASKFVVGSRDLLRSPPKVFPG